MAANSILDNISLTDDVLKNIIIMAPYLSEMDQNRVFGVIFGLLKNAGDNQNEANVKEAG